MQIHMSYHYILKTYELFFAAADPVRHGQMRFLRQMQARMPDECGCHRQFEKTAERNGVYPLYGMRQELSERSAAIKPAYRNRKRPRTRSTPRTTASADLRQHSKKGRSYASFLCIPFFDCEDRTAVRTPNSDRFPWRRRGPRCLGRRSGRCRPSRSCPSCPWWAR